MMGLSSCWEEGEGREETSWLIWLEAEEELTGSGSDGFCVSAGAQAERVTASSRQNVVIICLFFISFSAFLYKISL